MHSSLRHIYLIIGSILLVFGLLLFLFGNIESKNILISGGLFCAGAYLIFKAIKNPGERRNQLPDIRKKYKEKTDSINKDQDEVY